MAAQPLKCLFVSPALPWPPDTGGRVRSYHLLAELGARAEVHLRAVRDPGCSGTPAELERRCASVRLFERAKPSAGMQLARPKLERWFFSTELRAALAEELSRERFDVVHVDEMFAACALPRDSRTPVVVHHHKLDTDFQARLTHANPLAAAFDAFKLRRMEAESARRHRFHVLTNAAEARELSRRYPSITTAVVESGFEPAAFAPPSAPRAADELLFLGSLDYAPNVDAIGWFVGDVLPRIHTERPAVKLSIVGSGSDAAVREFASGSVAIVGRVDDVALPLARASALVIPLRIGGGTRLKLVEALGSETPVVSTTIGAEGLAFSDPEHLWLADSAADFAARTLELLADPAEAARRARRGRELALERYTWKHLAGELLAAWERAARS